VISILNDFTFTGVEEGELEKGIFDFNFLSVDKYLSRYLNILDILIPKNSSTNSNILLFKHRLHPSLIEDLRPQSLFHEALE